MISFGHLFADQSPRLAAGRLAAFLDGYHADDVLRVTLPTTMAQRARDAPTSAPLVRSWAGALGAMHFEGHGDLWNSTAVFIAHHEEVWKRALAWRVA